MAATITQAVLARFAAASLTDFDVAAGQPGYPGGLWLEEAPENALLPLIGVSHNGERPEYTTELDYQASGSYDFDIYAVTAAETERLALLVMAVFDACIKTPGLLTFTNGKVINWERTSYRIGVEGLRKSDNAQVGHASFTYEYMTGQKLPS